MDIWNCDEQRRRARRAKRKRSPKAYDTDLLRFIVQTVPQDQLETAGHIAATITAQACYLARDDYWRRKV